MLAVIKSGGKQYLVSPGDKIKIEKLSKKEGEEIIFEDVLLLEKNKKLEIGRPVVKGAKVKAKILRQGKGKKVIIFKYKAKKRYKKKQGHRQPFTEVEITKIQSTKSQTNSNDQNSKF
ncbi:MAG: 50S ribosomal protein L21 [Patescibacteria group bacterium]|nr:50S ribosomal protein L21 [Patescibacteria group bacterium]